MNKFDKYFEKCTNVIEALNVKWELVDSFPEEERQDIFEAFAKADDRILKSYGINYMC